MGSLEIGHLNLGQPFALRANQVALPMDEFSHGDHAVFLFGMNGNVGCDSQLLQMFTELNSVIGSIRCQ